MAKVDRGGPKADHRDQIDPDQGPGMPGPEIAEADGIEQGQTAQGAVEAGE